MLSNLALLLLLMLSDAPTPARPTTPAHIVAVTFTSKALSGERRYLAWLPPGYRQDAGVDYPVVVLLHGLGGEGGDWFDAEKGDLRPTLDRLMRDKRIAPFVALAPDGDNGYWTDHFRAPREGYGSFIDEVLANADARFDIAVERAAIVGVSMGGHGAMSRAFMAPGRYRAVVSLSGALFDRPPTHRPIYKKVWGFPADRGHWAATSPMAIVERSKPGDIRLPAVFLACGRVDADRFLDWNTEAAQLLTARGIAHELVLTEAGHTWTNWRSLSERWLPWMAPYLR